MITAAAIRAKFPDPVKSSQSGPTSYCVGGSLCLFQSRRFAALENPRFPDISTLSSVLCLYNPCLDRDHAYTLAERISGHNDGGEFDAAWQALDEALTYTDGSIEDWVTTDEPSNLRI